MLVESIKMSRAQGADLRAMRKTRGMTLVELAEKMDRSVGWLSQVERDISEPSVDDLRDFSKALNAPLSILMSDGHAPDDEVGYVVRRNARREIGRRVDGLTEELLSPDLTDDFEVVHSTFAAVTERKDFVTRPTQELGTILSGKMDVFIRAKKFTVEPGDSFRIKGEPFRWANPYNQPCVAIWVIAPPIY